MAAEAPAPRRGNRVPVIIVLVAVTAVVVLMFAGRDPWTVLFINPLINTLILLNVVTFGNFGLAIILFTLLLRIATIPMTIRQLESTKAMQTVQPLQAELQKKYKDPKRRQEEMMKLYKEHNINPLGCFFPLAIQMVTFIALYRALVYTVGGSPESLVGLSQRLYPLPVLQEQIPLSQHFIWMNLGHPDPTYLTPLIVGASTYLQQRMSITPNANPQMQQQQQMMTWMMPMMLMFITLSLPSGVGVYWVVSNIFSLFASYWVYGKRILNWRQLLPLPAEAPAPAPAAREKTPRADIEVSGSDYEITSESGPSADGGPARGEARSHGKRRGKRKKRR